VDEDVVSYWADGDGGGGGVLLEELGERFLEGEFAVLTAAAQFAPLEGGGSFPLVCGVWEVEFYFS
jgi:hypothetical protein